MRLCNHITELRFQDKLRLVAYPTSLAVAACLGLSAQQQYDPLHRPPESVNEIVSEMMQIADSQQQRIGPYTVQRRYTVNNSHMKSAAVLQVLWTYAPGLGKEFKVLASEGASGLARRALIEVLTTEAKNSRLNTDPGRISPAHYNFELIAREQNDVKLLLTPRRKSKYLVNGYAFVSRPDSALIRVEGTTSNRLSFWVGKAHVVQEFANYAGFWLPYKTKSTASVRFIGKTELTIEAEEYHFVNPP